MSSQWWFCERGRIISAEITRSSKSPLPEEAFVLLPSLTKESSVEIFIILSDILLLLSSPDQMVRVVLLNCIFTVFPLRLPCLWLLDLSDLSALLACGVQQRKNMLVKCWADFNMIPFYFLVFWSFR